MVNRRYSGLRESRLGYTDSCESVGRRCYLWEAFDCVVVRGNLWASGVCLWQMTFLVPDSCVAIGGLPAAVSKKWVDAAQDWP